MGRLRGRIRNLENSTAADVITVEHPDATTSRFHQDAVMECFLHETERGRRHFEGEDPGPAHPLTVALRTAINLEDLQRENGTILGLFVGEDEIIRGLRQRSGHAIRETSPGVYE